MGTSASFEVRYAPSIYPSNHLEPELRPRNAKKMSAVAARLATALKVEH